MKKVYSFLIVILLMSCSKQMDEAEQPIAPVTENEGYWIADPYYGETIYVAGYRGGDGCEYEYRIGASYAYMGRGWIVKSYHYSLKRTCNLTKIIVRWETESRQTKAEVKARLKVLRPDLELDEVVDELEDQE